MNGAPGSVPFDFGDLVGEAAIAFAPVDEGELRRATDPESATESVHWGRNYLYVTPWSSEEGPVVPVVVKQFRNAGFKARWRRRMRGTKAMRAFLVARALQALQIATPQPVLFADSVEPEGPSFFLSEHLEDRLELRYLLRTLAAGTIDEDYPRLRIEAVFESIGRMARTLHDGHIWHRDLTCGNLLIEEEVFSVHRSLPHGSLEGIYLLDLNRARVGTKLSLSERMRELCRLELPGQQMAALWRGYWREGDSGFRRRLGTALRTVYARAFLLRNRSKRRVRGFSRRLTDLLLARRKPHAHIPASTEGDLRERIVWDKLSDQPHQHASKWQKLRVRLVDAPEHARFLLRALRAYPQIMRRYREIEAARFTDHVQMDGFGVCVRPWSDDPQAVVDAVLDLGVPNVLLRLHPWQEEHVAELALARAVERAGLDLVFSLPQNRSLVREPELWQRRIRELARLFAPLGRTFQIGQAVNRSKWGVWRPSEYTELFALAAAELKKARQDVRLLGPSVIDFEFHQTAGYLFDRRPEALQLDGLASLLYVDRRGAPESKQLGLDAVGKGAVLRAIGDLAPCVKASEGGRRPLNWVTEVNWPLWEGPHSPAGRDVAVSEEEQARYLARYYLALLASGTVERIYWWQVIAKGYGLIDWQESAKGRLVLRRRPAFTALRTLVGELGGSCFIGWVGAAGENQWLLRFRRTGANGVIEEIAAGWSTGQRSAVDLPLPATKFCGLDGVWRDFEGGRRAHLSGEVQLFLLAPNSGAQSSKREN